MPSTILRDHGLSSLLDGEVESLADGFQFTEGPLWLPGEDALLFQDIKAEKTYRLGFDGVPSALRSSTKAANGQTFDSLGGIVFCEQNGRRVSRMNRDGTNVSTVAETYQGNRLNSPNDIVCRSDGLVYFTDPAYGVPSPEAKELPYQGVFSLSPDLTKLDLLLDDFEKPNGLALSPDERTLYVCDTGRYHVRSFSCDPSGRPDPSSSRVFCALDPGIPGGPDGMKVDRDGRVYVAVALGVWIFDAGGALLGILSLPKRPSNLAWSGEGWRTLSITMIDQVCRVRMKAEGVAPPFASGEKP